MTHGAPAPYTFTPYYTGEFKEFAYKTEYTNVVFNLPLFKITSDTGIYLLNILGGDSTRIRSYAWNLHNLLFENKINYDVIVSAEGKALPLVFEMASEDDIPYVIFRKEYKPYLGKELGAYYRNDTMTTHKMQALYLDNKDLPNIVYKKLLFVDDVISTGATLKACEHLVSLVGGQIVACASIALEGDYKPTDDFPHMKYVNMIDLPVVKYG